MQKLGRFQAFCTLPLLHPSRLLPCYAANLREYLVCENSSTIF